MHYFFSLSSCHHFSGRKLTTLLFTCKYFSGNSHFPLSAHPSLDSQDVYGGANASPRYSTGISKQYNLFQESSFAGPKENTETKEARNSDFFHGFLAIGTLGGETFIDEPATPTFGMTSGDPATDNAEVTENDLKLISNELEKFLEAEAKEGHNQPSGRNSDTNTIASTIEAAEGVDAEEDDQPMKFPLQEYLFGSQIELSEPKVAGKKERASLGELFQATEVQEKHSENKYEEKKKKASSTHKSAKHLVKKVLKKLHLSSRSPDSGKTEVASTKKKFQKVWFFFLCSLKRLSIKCNILKYTTCWKHFLEHFYSTVAELALVKSLVLTNFEFIVSADGTSFP